MKNGSMEWMIEISKKLFRLYSPSLHFIIIICALTIQSSFSFSILFGWLCLYIDIAALLNTTCYICTNGFA